MKKIKIFELILTYDCEHLVQKAIDSIPKNKFDKIICSDDGSTDKTEQIVKKNNIEFFQIQHSGYGANLFHGLRMAFKIGAIHVVEIHGDGQYKLNNINDDCKNEFYLNQILCLEI